MSRYDDEPTVHPVAGYPAPDWDMFSARWANALYSRGSIIPLPISGDATTLHDCDDVEALS